MSLAAVLEDEPQHPGQDGLAHDEADIKPPSLLLAMADPGYALFEMAMLPTLVPLTQMAPSGDGHPVLVLPGFMGDDRSTAVLRRFLSQLGYQTHKWDLGRNFGPLSIGPEGELLSVRLMKIFRQSRRKVSVVGWSLGGIMARELAKAMPNQVRQVITLGSPFGGNPRATNVARLFERVTGQSVEDREDAMMIEGMKTPPPGIPTTSIFTKRDGVVAWQNCLEQPSPLTDNIEVRTSHIGLGLNGPTLFAVGDRLACSESDWTPFDRSGWRRFVYPSSGHGI